MGYTLLRRAFTGYPNDFDKFVVIDGRIYFAIETDDPFFKQGAVMLRSEGPFPFIDVPLVSDLSPWGVDNNRSRVRLQRAADAGGGYFAVPVISNTPAAEKINARIQGLARSLAADERFVQRPGYITMNYALSGDNLSVVFREEFGSTLASIYVNVVTGEDIDPATEISEKWWERQDCRFNAYDANGKGIDNYVPPKDAEYKDLTVESEYITFTVHASDGEIVNVSLRLNYGGDNEKFVLLYSSAKILTDKDLRDLSKENLRAARNEIYARYGATFKDKTLQDYFDGKTWYQNIAKLPQGAQPAFTELELANIEIIKSYELKY